MPGLIRTSPESPSSNSAGPSPDPAHPPSPASSPASWPASSPASSPASAPAPAGNSLSGPPRRHRGARLAYGLLFCLVLPFLLWLWSRSLPLDLPGHRLVFGGAALIAGGLLIMGIATLELLVLGHGLPMNPFPPTCFVTRGIYALLPHPIYTGFCAVVLGFSLFSGSAAGLWVVSPLVMLGCVAIVWGYERHDLRRRFPTLADAGRPWLRLPDDEPDAPSPGERFAVIALVLVPWVALYEILAWLPLPAHPIETWLPSERGWPVLQDTYIFYVSLYVMPLFPVFLARTRRDLTSFARAGLLGTALGMYCFVALPLVSPSRAFVPTSALGRMLAFERSTLPAGTLAFPSFHAFWALLSAWSMTRRGWAWGVFGWGWASLVVVSCVTTGMHAIVDLAAAALLFGIVIRAPGLYRQALKSAERVANSFRIRRAGPVRVISHWFYPFGGAAAGVGLGATLAGPESLGPLALVTVCAVVGAALWAQLIEGSPRLLRPFGYYGAIFGGAFGCLAAAFLGASPLLLLAALAVAAPVIQAIGRLRCLVQGCCHGRPAHPEEYGIRTTNPSSRVTRYTPWTGVPLHPTQVYSIIGNLLAGGILFRLYTEGARQALVLGLYFLFAGLARFVEEAYRGEPQTRWFAGLSEYQWLSMGFVVGGAVLTALPFPARCPAPEPDLVVIPWALAAGVFTALAMSVDLPDSNRRFARLTG